LLDGREIFVIAADSGLITAEESGFKPAFIIGDMDSLDDESRLSVYPPERVIRYPHDKDYTDTELAFSLAVEKGCDDIWLIGGGGGRIDHLFAIRSLFEREHFPRRWITDAEDIYCIDSKTEQNELSLNLKKGAVVSVFPLGSGPWKAASKGLKWPLDDLTWDRGFFGLSNVAVDGDFSVFAKAGRFFVIIFLEE
jgi:thiamine pyrophosphokinase